ncbi:MAG: T9SS type A sorting domain-containing protein [Candidatus Goldbacteria bacterium]|nr:T9SS type A sorting domain-containing protein [Candidatus Goldiibacteriota bacterium]
MLKRFLILLILQVFAVCAAFAAGPKIISAVMNPSNPKFGQEVTVTVEFCASKYSATAINIAVSSFSTKAPEGTVGQIFLVSSLGIDVPSENPNPYGEIHYIAADSDIVAVNNCIDCGSDTNSRIITKQYVFHIPDISKFPGCEISDFYLHVGLNDYFIRSSEWIALDSCSSVSASWTIPYPGEVLELKNAKTEGKASLDGDLVLFSCDYAYTGGVLNIESALPADGKLKIVSCGPSEYVMASPTAGSQSGTITWVLQDRMGMPALSSGRLWFTARLQKPPAVDDEKIAVPFNASLGSKTKSLSASLTVNQNRVLLNLSQSKSSAMIGDTVTYVINYAASSSALRFVDLFDNMQGIYTASVPPLGWKYVSDAGAYGTWSALSICSTGNKYLESSSVSNVYPGMVLDDAVQSNAEFCTGTILTDVRIQPGSNPGADAQVIIRSNGLADTLNSMYSLLLSIDSSPNGYVSFQKCVNGNCTWPSYTSTFIINPDTWYSVKVEASSEFYFSAKVWKKGEPEPSAWTLVYNDVNGLADGMNCSSGASWRPGINHQGYSSDTKNNYDDFMVFNSGAGIISGAVVYDTVPAGIIYLGNSNSGTITGDFLSWTIGTLAESSGAFTWWGKVNACGSITNTAGFSGASPFVPVFSNTLLLQSEPCYVTPVVTPTVTITPCVNTPFSYVINPMGGQEYVSLMQADGNASASCGSIQLVEVAFQQQAGGFYWDFSGNTWSLASPDWNAATGTDNWTFTNMPLFNPGESYTIFSRSTDTLGNVEMPGLGNTFSIVNPSPTVTVTATNTVTESATGTATSTATQTSTNSVTQTVTGTITQTASPSATQTNTQTGTPTITLTNSPSNTNTKTATQTATKSSTLTATQTITLTATSSTTMTITATVSGTNTPSVTRTNTQTDTPTDTPVDTVTDTKTPTPSETYTYTETPTDTFTLTPTDTFTATNTFTYTYTPTITPTFTNSPTPKIDTALDRNYAEPLKGDDIKISVKAAAAGELVEIKVYNLSGEKIRQFNFITASAGWNEGFWDCKNDAGKTAGQGLYFIRITREGTVETRKVFIIK